MPLLQSSCSNQEKIMRTMDKLNRYQGAMLGLAIGDALGTTLEFKSPGSFVPITDIVGGGPFNLQAGQWTDDTSMALCLADSILSCHGFNLDDQIQRYIKWYREGYMSSTGRCFDIGNTVSSALVRYEHTKEPCSGSTDLHSAGNGSLMRLVPVPLAYAHDPLEAIRLSGESSLTTHGAIECIDACRYYAALIVGALAGEDKEALCHPFYEPVKGVWEKAPLTSGIANIAGGSFKAKNPPAIKGTGYVVDSMEAALWAFYKSDNFKEGALMAVNLGDDADTTGAIYGQLAGAYYGLDGIPEQWRNGLHDGAMIIDFATRLYASSKGSRL